MKVFLEWLDDWQLGIYGIDRHHQEMAELLNRIVGSLDSEEEISSGEETLPLILNLLDKTRRHFKVEEAVMRGYGYPGLGEHHREHVLLLAELQEFIRETEEGRHRFDLETLTALKHWLINHVLESDLAFARYLHGSQRLRSV